VVELVETTHYPDEGPEPTMTNREPTLVGGRYELGELLGRGGMAEVRKGVDRRLGRAVAVKRLRTDLASDATFQARFRREAQSSASLNHPAIVAVYDTGEEMSTDGTDVAQPYIVMEFVAGRTLRDILKEGRKILPERALEITSGVLSALDYSHRAGIIHRDIKPGNVMLTPTGDVKVMDFGIARAVSDASSSMTQTAAVVGTAQYLSPEQARGETVDSRSDVYSTGCLLYELLTGRPPFVGDSPVAVAYQHVREPAQPPSDFDTEITPEMDAIVMKALAKRVEDRYQSSAAMRNDIERYLSGRPVQAPAVATSMTSVLPTSRIDDHDDPTSAAPPLAPLPPDRHLEDEDREPSRAGLYFLLGFLLVALIGGAAYLLPRLFEQPPANDIRVPGLIGLSEQQALNAIADAGLERGDVSYEASEDAERDRVIEQEPNRDEFVEEGTPVDIVVSTGAPMVTVPSVVGQDLEAALATLEAAGLRATERERNSDEPQGEVLETDPAAGESVPEGTAVTVFFSDGPEEVPDVVGMRQGAAERELREAGFEVFVTTTTDTTEPRGTVVRQNPPAGSTWPEGTSVTIEVSAFEEEPTPTPTPTTTTPTEVPTESPSVPPTPEEGGD
jgi:serine/threonine protein kinase/beta-lactam-binding protein with PASTA domain